jgi:hypothetical protein
MAANAGAAGTATVLKTTSLLPPPMEALSGMEGLYLLMVNASAQQQKNGKTEVEGKFKEKREALEKYKAEVAKAAEDQKSGSFWKTVAKVGMVVAAVAATVASYGAAGPVVVAVAIALSAGGFLVDETKCLGEASPWVGMAMEICGSLLTGGGGVASSVASSASSTATMVEGGVKINDAVHQHSADLDMREAKAAQQQMRRIQTVIEDVITALQDDKESKDHGAETINKVIETQSDTLLIAAGAGART